MAWQSDMWLLPNRITNFRYIRARKTEQGIVNVEEIAAIEETGGTIEYQDSTSLKVSASLPFVGNFDVGNDYIRIYSSSSIGATREEVLHGTFLWSNPKTDYSGAVARGTIECYSLLLLVEQAKLRAPLSLPPGTAAVAKARELVESCGLTVISDTSTMVLSMPHNYRAGESVLKVVNELLTSAGFSLLNINPAGEVLMTRYTDPANREPVLILRDDKQGVFFGPEVKHTFDTFEVPNEVTVICSAPDDVAGMSATAINNDPASQFSVPSRGGQIIVHVEEVSECESQAALQAMANRILSEKTGAVESIDVTHPYYPYVPGDAIRLMYTRHGLDIAGAVTSQTLRLNRAMTCDVHVRRFIRM